VYSRRTLGKERDSSQSKIKKMFPILIGLYMRIFIVILDISAKTLSI